MNNAGKLAMSEKTSGLYRLVTIPKFYNFFQSLLGGDEVRDKIKREYFSNLKGKRVLEVGCGPGIWFPWFQECDYFLGLDWNAEHIKTANEKWASEKSKFECRDVTTLSQSSDRKFDVVIAFGLLHHINDADAKKLLSHVYDLLAEDGRIITIDPVYHKRQNPIATIMNKMDSGQHIRTQNDYTAIVLESFKNLEAILTTNRLRIPYSHLTMVCHK